MQCHRYIRKLNRKVVQWLLNKVSVLDHDNDFILILWKYDMRSFNFKETSVSSSSFFIYKIYMAHLYDMGHQNAICLEWKIFIIKPIYCRTWILLNHTFPDPKLWNSSRHATECTPQSGYEMAVAGIMIYLTSDKARSSVKNDIFWSRAKTVSIIFDN